MPRSMQEIIDQADELASRFESYSPAPDDERDARPLESLRSAVAKRAAAETAIVQAVGEARDAGYSWAGIGALLGTSGEAARQRYAQAVTH
ncbi:hypothetical protein EV191_12829 [Tamaricihabitans halophyticus]|uniref:Uncharacterized protein n=1 Tax=Tamaricihabitans halophyticus TaxID=1262583 RepID=A0A4R2PXN6_9PSEU|nr:hypothetical protein [Tamaricihabitans halophyticus]TCP40779.1 hypothetical protein EV191_12829 [Tamaricihabitans halophyticus]